ncbi:MAG TPA: glycerol-3-phosphate dehydrogenase [Gemmatimonadaceae bacterium]|nr:glycerol-3-phosphate dehydrogenase [Gemmatimonadaceae bacterium]
MTEPARTSQYALSPLQARAAALDALGARRFDLLVIGGGVTGCAIARDAAMRGMSVALVERADLASGTSSRSSRLVHGGLRYLEHGELPLVFESTRERRILHRIAPHLVRPLRFVWPVYERARIPRWKVGAGLFLYDALALFRNLRSHRVLDADDVVALEPALARDALEGGAEYYDAATDDARLTVATARAAQSHGAVIVTHAAAATLHVEQGHVTGTTVHDAIGGRTVSANARVVVNATGPWSDAVSRMARTDLPPAVRGSMGTHIAVPRERAGNVGALTILSPDDARVMFILPAERFTIVGTTDTEYAGTADDVRATADDIAYLLRAANAYLPAADLTPDDVVSAWAGVRPLAAQPDGAPGELSREHAITWIMPGLLSVTGGKLTTNRAMAAQVVDHAARALRATRPARAPTWRTPLPGGEIASVAATIAAAAQATGATDVATHLVHSYGSEWRAVWALAARDRALAERLEPSLPYIAAELRWGVEHELALTLGDLLIRRTHVAFETRDHGRAVAARAAQIIAPILGWDAAAIAAELARYDAEVTEIFTVRAVAGSDAAADRL